jgi:hypothetical protein
VFQKFSASTNSSEFRLRFGTTVEGGSADRLCARQILPPPPDSEIEAAAVKAAQTRQRKVIFWRLFVLVLFVGWELSARSSSADLGGQSVCGHQIIMVVALSAEFLMTLVTKRVGQMAASAPQ